MTTPHIIIDTARQFVRERLGTETTGHDYWHAHRVYSSATTIQAKEGGDLLVIQLAALLHDVGDRKVIGGQEDDPSIARDFLDSLELDKATIEAVMHIIEHMSYSKSLDNPDIHRPIEFLIVQDADRLDALGAIGIARCFAYGGKSGRLLHDPTYQPHNYSSTEDYKANPSPSLAHFDEKLFKLNGSFNTEAAKEIADSRDAYMHEFYDRFLMEWDGKL